MSENKPKRKHPVHGVYAIRDPYPIVFDTVCTKGRDRWLDSDDVHQLLLKVWKEADAWLLGRYVILPDHIHFFAAATDSPIEYENWVKYWKSQFSKQHQNRARRWQFDHWDQRMRTEQQYEEKWQYVLMNPVRSGLVEHPEDWPYQGEVYQFRW